MHFLGSGILLDVEGTTSSVSFVYDVLFPYARKHVASFLARFWNDPAVERAIGLIARDAGVAEQGGGLADWLGSSLEEARQRVVAEVLSRMDRDEKTTGLKELQGLIWKEGYATGALVSHVYSDVPAALRRWSDAGIDLRIYSSGSIAAQKVFFQHTEAGDLTPFLRGHYDTTLGPKRSPASYAAIARDMDALPNAILFFSDVVAELDAARAAGLQTVLVVRPGNTPFSDHHDHEVITSFDQVLCGS